MEWPGPPVQYNTVAGLIEPPSCWVQTDQTTQLQRQHAHNMTKPIMIWPWEGWTRWVTWRKPGTWIVVLFFLLEFLVLRPSSRICTLQITTETWLKMLPANFSRMRSKGSRFTLGPGGLRLCSQDVTQPSAAVRNRPREVAMAVPMASSAKMVTFGSFNGRVASFRVASFRVASFRVASFRVASFRVAGVALCDTPTRFIMCRKSFCVGSAISLRRF